MKMLSKLFIFLVLMVSISFVDVAAKGESHQPCLSEFEKIDSTDLSDGDEGDIGEPHIIGKPIYV